MDPSSTARLKFTVGGIRVAEELLNTPGDENALENRSMSQDIASSNLDHVQQLSAKLDTLAMPQPTVEGEAVLGSPLEETWQDWQPLLDKLQHFNEIMGKIASVRLARWRFASASTDIAINPGTSLRKTGMGNIVRCILGIPLASLTAPCIALIVSSAFLCPA